VASRSVEEARKKAAEYRMIVEDGGDPLADLEAKRAEATVRELVDRYTQEVLPARAPRTAAEYKAILAAYLLPALGNKKVAAVEPDDVAKIHRQISAEGKQRPADAVVTAASIVFAHAVKWKMRPDNPCRGAVERNNPPGRERYLRDDERVRLWQTLDFYQADRVKTRCSAATGALPVTKDMSGIG